MYVLTAILDIRICFCFLTEEERDWIGRDVTEEEVKDGLWSLRPFKPSGPDGLHAGFINNFGEMWGIRFAKKFWIFLSIGRCLNILIRPLLL